MVDAMVPPGQGWLFGQSLLDLGALVCGGHRIPPAIAARCAGGAGGRSADGAIPIPPAARPEYRWPSRCSTDPIGRAAGAWWPRCGTAGEHGGPGRVMGWPDDRARAERVAAELAGEGLSTPRRGGRTAVRGGRIESAAMAGQTALPAASTAGQSALPAVAAEQMGQEGHDVVVDLVGLLDLEEVTGALYDHHARTQERGIRSPVRWCPAPYTRRLPRGGRASAGWRWPPLPPGQRRHQAGPAVRANIDR